MTKDTTPGQTRRSFGFITIILLLAVAVGAAAYVWQTRFSTAHAEKLERASLANAGTGETPGGSFALTDQDGKRVTEQSYGGKYMLVTFGFTYCPDVCPTKLQDISLTLDRLGEDAKRVQPLFITIDPQRDTPAQLKNYVSLYQGNIQGLTGTPNEIAAAARTFKIFYRRGEDVGDGNYMMDHSTNILFLDPQGKVLESFGDEVDAEKIAQTIKTLLPRP